MKKLKERWGISSNWQLILILTVFSVTGSSSVYITKPFLDWIGFGRDSFSPDFIWGGLIYFVLKLILIFPFYQLLLIFFGWLFGQFRFFWEFEKKMLNRLGLGFIFK